MRKAEPHHNPAQPQPAARQGGAALASPQGGHIAQLEAMMESSPQAEKQAQLAAMMNASPSMAAQRRLADMIHNSPRQIAQRKAFDAVHNSPLQTAQRKKIEGLFGTAQRQETEEPLQPKSETAQRAEAAPRPNHTGLPDNLKNGIESLSGLSMDSVRVHYNSSQPAQLNAHAYAQGTDIHVAPGQERHLPHEAWHVVQQAQGRVQPTTQMKESVPVNDDNGLEHEADVMGARATGIAAERGSTAIPAHPAIRQAGAMQLLKIDGNQVANVEAMAERIGSVSPSLDQKGVDIKKLGEKLCESDQDISTQRLGEYLAAFERVADTADQKMGWDSDKTEFAEELFARLKNLAGFEWLDGGAFIENYAWLCEGWSKEQGRKEGRDISPELYQGELMKLSEGALKLLAETIKPLSGTFESVMEQKKYAQESQDRKGKESDLILKHRATQQLPFLSGTLRGMLPLISDYLTVSDLAKLLTVSTEIHEALSAVPLYGMNVTVGQYFHKFKDYKLLGSHGAVDINALSLYDGLKVMNEDSRNWPGGQLGSGFYIGDDGDQEVAMHFATKAKNKEIEKRHYTSYFDVNPMVFRVIAHEIESYMAQKKEIVEWEHSWVRGGERHKEAESDEQILSSKIDIQEGKWRHSPKPHQIMIPNGLIPHIGTKFQLQIIPSINAPIRDWQLFLAFLTEKGLFK